MKRIPNPWTHIEGFNCFGCSQNNPIGLKMNFEEGEHGEIICHWKPNKYYQGWIGVIHGGIQSTLIDEMAEWVIVHDLHCSGVTSKLSVKYLKGLKSTDREITIKGRLTKSAHKLAWIEVSIENERGETCTTGEALYMTYPDEKEDSPFYIKQE